MFFWQYGFKSHLIFNCSSLPKFCILACRKKPQSNEKKNWQLLCLRLQWFFFNEAFLLGIMQNALCFWAIKPQCVKILYFISVGLFCSANRGESPWSLHWWITPRCSHVSQLCEKKVAQVCEDRSFCRVLVNSGQYCNISGGPWQASNLTMSLKYRQIQNGSFFCVFLL